MVLYKLTRYIAGTEYKFHSHNSYGGLTPDLQLYITVFVDS